jgi:hypothetical protein
MTVAGGLALALASTAALNWGWVAQYGAARNVPSLSLARPLTSLRRLFSNPSWLAGFLVGIGGWAFYVAALALAPLSLVQAVCAGGIAVLALLARRRGEQITSGHWAAVAVSTVGLALLGLSLAGGASGAATPGVGALGAWLVGAVLVAAGAAAGGSRLAAGAGLGIAAGTLYATGDLATKAAVFGGGWLAVVPVVLLAHGAAFVALQLGFQRGRALATAGTATLLTNALPIAAGLILFDERLPAGAPGALRLLAFACVVVGAAMLARDEDMSTGRREVSEREPEPAPGLSRPQHLLVAARVHTEEVTDARP